MSGREQAVGARGGEAGEDGEPECSAHHERRVDDARGEPSLALLDVAHCREQHRIERRSRAEAEQDHAREDVDDEAPADRRPREEREPDGREQQPDSEGRPDPEPHHELG